MDHQQTFLPGPPPSTLCESEPSLWWSGLAMAEDLKRYLYKQLVKVDGLHAIVISDRDGVPIIKVATENAPETALRPSFLGTFALATDQGSKLGLSKNKSIVCYYSSFQGAARPGCGPRVWRWAQGAARANDLMSAPL
uniref:Ragulator complex protein LAMTOR3 isoform X2 n=1 Tax=Petromyzon marinus TaxID=7757 RepID=A0AAJ7TVY7_PETMA|nr:ragulator complex protein LAMTOR3 isoform X2 [Petromyzon marinus]